LETARKTPTFEGVFEGLKPMPVEGLRGHPFLGQGDLVVKNLSKQEVASGA
jgi:hypothetical protein